MTKEEIVHKWNKDRPGYKATHKWLKRHYGAADHCSKCDTPSKRYEWANLSGEYLRDVNDYIQLCASCHRKMDYTEQQSKNRSLARRGIPMLKLRKPVVQLSREGEFIERYNSAQEAAEQTGVKVHAIIGTRNGYQATGGGFRWIKA